MASETSNSRLVCGGCGRELKPGDRYIEDTASGFVGADADPMIDGLIADIYYAALYFSTPPERNPTLAVRLYDEADHHYRRAIG